MLSEFLPSYIEEHNRCPSPPLSQAEPSPTTETDIVTTTLEIDRLDLHYAIDVADTVEVADLPFKPNDNVQDEVQVSFLCASIRDDDYDNDVESFITASTFCEDLEKSLPGNEQVDPQRAAEGDEDSSSLEGAMVTGVMGDCPNCESSAAILTIEDDAEIIKEVEQDSRQACASSPAVSFAEVAIRVASPFLPQWITSPLLPLPALHANPHTDGSKQQQSSSLEPRDKAIELVTPPERIHRDRRQMGQERHFSEEVATHPSYSAVPSSPVTTTGPFELYWKLLPSIRSGTMDTDHDASTLYEGSIRSSRTYAAASLLSTQVRMDDVAEEEGGKDTPKHGEDHRTVRFSFPPSSGHHNHHHHSHYDNHQGHTLAGAEAVGRISTFMVSTGKSAFGYLVESVVPTTIDLVHRGATTTLEVVNAGLQLPRTVLQSTTLPRFLHHQHHSSSPDAWPPSGIPQEGRHPSDSSSTQSHAISTPEVLSFHIRSSAGNGPVVPESLHSRDHYRLTADPGTGTSPHGLKASQRPRPQPRQKRRYPLQTIPGPDGLDPQIRRELEAQGLASLGLRDGTEGRDWRNWWDPRRYGLPKYVICHELRTPRPCTLILLAILVVCIVCKLSQGSHMSRSRLG